MNEANANAIIIRVPDVDGSKTFAHIPLAGSDLLLAEAKEFHVLDGDDYNLLGFDSIVLAVMSAGGDSSVELARADVVEEDGGVPAVLHSDPIALVALVRGMVEDWNASAPHAL